ncbi:hypothetical protein HRE53_31905 (plasmid) [Acaryochloris sp. 'Moss Beach']|uniref:DUF4062 domain-containing protein n=1 Tax=Acaryochloris sp. 'Moss Beach' TaxID=2740837 RepID=UPI001F48D732|nr:DUF4062 domain-containing protein [Acaryochloris sp. 'Moss Beach']UJB73182.1 hypothetical protein HRE53_31905 [Acaryochloris sp. 'Moss Beach']
MECQLSAIDVPLNLLLAGFEIPAPHDLNLAIPTEPKIETSATMNTIKIFLASSSELKADRQQFEIFINRENKKHVRQGIFFELVLWEDFLDAMSPTRSQDEYNKAVAECDVFVSLFHTKAGKYTEEEFLKALETFKAHNRPLIYTYFKGAAVNLNDITSEILSLLNFKQKLKDLEHFYTTYNDINDLKHQFGEQLPKLLSELGYS